MELSELSDIVIKIAQTTSLTTAQKYELIGRFSHGLLGGEIPSAAVAQAPATPQPAAGKIIIPADSECQCAKCSNIVYTTVTDVWDNMPTKAFLEAFMPAEVGVPKLTRDVEIWADPGGNLAIDCPICGSENTLWIKGRGMDFKDIPEGSQDTPLKVL